MSWTITSGTLPAGLTLNSDGTITGTPTTPTTQAANFTVNATIGEGASSIFTTQVLTISVTKSDAELGGLTISGNTGIAEGAFQYGDTITVTFTPERKTETNTNSLAENTATLTYTNAGGETVTLATAATQSDGSFELSYDTKEKKLPIGENLTLTVSYGGSGALNPVEKELTVTLEQAILKNMPTVTGSFVYGETLTVNYTKQDDESVTYQWYRGGEKISDATENSYTLTAEDISKNIYVIVSATDEWHRGAMQSRQQEVAKAQGSIEIACDSVTYGEPVQPSVASNTNTGADVAYSYAGTGSTSYGPSNEAPENAGTYTVTATVAETATHTSAESEPVGFTISKAELTITGVDVQSKTYDGTTAATVTGVSFKGLVNGEALAMGTDYTATADFDGASADTFKSVTGKVTLLSSTLGKNYVLSDASFLTSGDISAAASKLSFKVDRTKPVKGQYITFSVTPQIKGDNRSFLQRVLGINAPKVEFWANGTTKLGEVKVEEGKTSTFAYDTDKGGLKLGKNTITAEFTGDGNLKGCTESVVVYLHDSTTSAPTGDTSNIQAWTVVLAVSAVVLIGIGVGAVIYRKKKK